jgi:hypothetical protein
LNIFVLSMGGIAVVLLLVCYVGFKTLRKKIEGYNKNE